MASYIAYASLSVSTGFSTRSYLCKKKHKRVSLKSREKKLAIVPGRESLFSSGRTVINVSDSLFNFFKLIYLDSPLVICNKSCKVLLTFSRTIF